jgi:terminase small subunit|nr:MAG TPA: terminase small subunit [Bacteriophage sp.]
MSGKEKRPIGRPSKFSQDLAEKICEQIAHGKSLRAICAEDDMPSTSTVCKWLNENQEFSEQYARARGRQADHYFEEIVEIADSVEADSAAVAKARLQVDARKWAASKLAPKKYGEKTELDVKSSDGSMTPTVRLDAEEYRKIAEDVLRRI